MKKFLAVISLMLVALMVIAIPAVSAADETIDKPDGIAIHYAADVSGNEPSIDGTISDGEYGDAIRITTPKALKNSDWGSSWETGAVDETLASEYFDIYFAYDEENIYFAFYELGAAPTNLDDDDTNTDNNVPFRNNYRFRFGLELDNQLNYFQTDSGSTVGWKTINTFFSGTRKDQSEVTFDQFSELVVTKKDVNTDTYVAFGDFFSTGNANYVGGQWALVVEWKFDKAGFVEAWNTIYGTEYDYMSNGMWVEMTTNAFRCIEPNYKEPFDGQYFRWLGQNDITGNGADYADYGLRATSTSCFDLVVFGTEDDELILADPFPPATEAPTTEAPETDPETTEAPATEAPTTEAEVTTEAPATEAPETEAEVTTEAPATEAPTTDAPKTEAPTTEAPAANESGCGSTVGVAGLALVAALGTCTVFVSKKRD